MRRLPALLAGLGLLLLLRAGLANAALLGQLCPGISLRYAAPLPAQAVEQALAEHPGTVAFWAQTRSTVQGDWTQAEATVLRYRGQAELVWPSRCTAGSLPPKLDEVGCALSQALAWQLFGSTQVVGLSVTVDGQRRPIRGVLDAPGLLLLLPAGDTDGFTALELAPTADAWRDPEAWVSQWLPDAGLAAPERQLYGGEVSALARLSLWAPAFVAGLWALVALARASRRWPAPLRDGVLLALLLLFACALPAGLARLPTWLIPTRWSDFSWWSRLGSVLAARAEQWLALAPFARDVWAKQCLAKHLALLLAQGILWEVLRCSRPHGKQ